MDDENVIQIYNIILFSCKVNEIMKFGDERMEVENTILSEVTQSEKEKHRTFSFTCASWF